MAKEGNAIELLKQDHRQVESMFQQLEAEEGRGKIDIAQRICLSLMVHAAIEEEIFYPAARQALDEQDRAMVAEAKVEHGSLKQLIDTIGGSSAQDEMLGARLSVLQEYVQHHVKEEEDELMPAVKKTDLDLAALGAKLKARKEALMEQYRPYIGRNGSTVKLPPASKRAGKSAPKRAGSKRSTAKRASSRASKRGSSSSRRRAQR